MDPRTLAAYDDDAPAFAREWDAQPPPSDMHALLLRYFQPGPTADVGCGGGRDAAWLNANRFPATGYDASRGLLAEARRLHPDVEFHHAVLPELDAAPRDGFANVLCETVIMHLPPEALAPSVRTLMAILQPGGVLYLSWRVTEGADRRDDLGRLYAAFDPAIVLQALAPNAILFDEQATSASSGKTIRRLIARKTGGV
jgi:SAM-dependent methyltransferase